MASYQRERKRQRLLYDATAVEDYDSSQPDPICSTMWPLVSPPKTNCRNDKLTIANLVNSPTPEVQDNRGEIVCFGVVTAIDGKCAYQTYVTEVFPVRITSSDSFSSEDTLRHIGNIAPIYGPMIDGLLSEKSLILHASCKPDFAQKSRTPATFAMFPCILDITVYGPLELFDEIGDWFQEYEIFLQDPSVCHLDVRYCNPQRLSSQKSELTLTVSEYIAQSSRNLHFQIFSERPDLLDLISGLDDLDETIPSSSICTPLHRHQKQALTFMLRREKGWMLGDAWKDIWEPTESSLGMHYINRITNQTQAEPPEQCFGGIVADPMGLGKTLTMIALSVHDDSEISESSWTTMNTQDDVVSIKSTLIIVPPALLSTWEEQFKSHVISGHVNVYRHHDKSRLKTLDDLNNVHVVLTTYQTLLADWNARNSDFRIMFAVNWRRCILDEAHVIRNVKTRMARAIYEIQSNFRWVVTGTPVQNNISDLAALLRFIRAHPYDDVKKFESDISRMWKAGEDEEAVKRLKRLSRCLILRRAQKTIDLPRRHDLKCPVEFKASERALYESIRQQAILRINDAIYHDMELTGSVAYVNFLQRIESMRLVCNLGLHYHSRHEPSVTTTPPDWTATAQQAFNSHREMNTILCSQCSSSLEMTESLMDDSVFQDSPTFSRCLKYACAQCSHDLRIVGHTIVCDHTPCCPVAPISVSASALETTFGHSLNRGKGKSRGEDDLANHRNLPSKIEALVSDLKTLPVDVKSIVFSTWRLTLDIVETALNQAGIQCVRFDGKVPQAQRKPVLDRFRKDPNIRVMLLTLQCGAVGLTLTEASRAYLMEPHWNPTIEDQALARIHRIGQTREVTTVRFYIRDSFEERVMEVQEKKKNLAGVLLSGHDGGEVDDSLGALQRLRDLL